MFTFPIAYLGNSSIDVLDSVISSVCCDLDATISDSYGGSGQTWANLIASPADGAAQTGYDFFLGADGSSSTDDPAFTGSAGDSAAFFAMDGGDRFKSKAITNTVAMKNAHRTDVSGTWVAMAMLPKSAAHWWGNNHSGGTAGVRLTGSTGNLSTFFESNGSTLLTLSNIIDHDNNTDVLFILSWDGTSTTNNMRLWINSTTKSEVSGTFKTSTSSSAIEWGIGGTQNGFSEMVNTSKVYHFSMGNAFIDDADAAIIFTHLEARHNRDYTP